MNLIIDTPEGEILVTRNFEIKEDNESGDRDYPDFRVWAEALNEAFDKREQNLKFEAEQLSQHND